MSVTQRTDTSTSAAGQGQAAIFTEFLNPNSMITPGAAGAATMLITNTLCQQFTQLPLNYTGLAISFLFGTMVFGYGASLLSRFIYFVINSLIIFVVAAGSSAVGAHLNRVDAAKTASLSVTQPAGESARTFSLASTDKAADKKADPDAPASTTKTKKPDFFRNWL